jgi:hypothetical protein
MAREYHRAANTLFIAKEVASPLYFLYAHTFELAFKAYLAAHRASVPIRGKRAHDLGSLCKSCQNHGLRVNRELTDVIHLLESENKEHGFRYFVFKPTGIPEIGYLREVVDDLMVIVAKDVERTCSKDSDKAVLKFIFGKPEKKSVPCKRS